MLRTIILSAVASQLLFAVDQDTLRNSVFKITSKAPGTSKELRGSGTMFSKGGKYFVLTSDHVVVHSNELGVSTTAKCAQAGCKSLQLTFLASEWGYGLSLLQVDKGQPAGKVLTYEELLAEASVKEGDTAGFLGYPFDSNDLIEETGAKLLKLKVALPYYVLAPELLELDSLVGEFGMSGGGAFSADGHFLGVLAYQRILNGTRDNRVYAVPHSIVSTWLKHYFEVTKDYKPVFSEPWWGQGQPDQVMLTNDGYFFAFRLMNGEVRMAGARMEALIILKDGPSIRYDDTRGLLKAFRADLDKNVYAPAEFSLIDRTLEKPELIAVQYPAFAVSSLSRKGISLFIARGETHELRYGRFKPVVNQLSKDIGELKGKMTAISSNEWKVLSEDLDALMKRFNAIPPKPTDPGTAGASEFFSSRWLATTQLMIETNGKLAGWNSAGIHGAAVKADFTKLMDSLNVLEMKGH